MGESRQALIIAVPKYELADEFGDLTETVGHDVELMADALASSGYSVELIGDTPEEPAQGPRIRSAISRVCATAPEDGTVLIHFTGHGLSIGGADHLVPADAQLTWATTPPQVDVDSLIGLDLAKLLRGSRAGTVLITVDACRDETGTASYGGPATNFPAGQDRIAVLFGCGAGQTCGSDETQGSHFSRALAEALHADSSPRTVAEVIAHTVRRTTEIARHAREVQTPTPHYHPSGQGAIEEVTLCAGRTLQEEWTLAVRDAELWAAVTCDEDRGAALRSALVELTSVCAKWCGKVSAGAPDPWADDDYPVRVLKKGLRLLLAPSQTQGGPLLDAGEFAALAAAPFVREAVLAMGVKEVSTADPFQLEPATGAAARLPARVDLEPTFAAHALLWRKGRELAGRGRHEDATAVAAWLLRRHVSTKEELWDTYAPQLLAPLAKVMAGDDAPASRIGELTDELVRVCAQTAVAPTAQYEGERDPIDTRWSLDELELPDGTAERWRPRELSWLIGVAGMLGGDLRLLPGVLVDNIGITDGLVPAAAVQSVRRLRWVRDRLNKVLDLALECPHPAVHAALETLTGWTDEAVQTIRKQLAPAQPADLLAHLPVRVTCRKLKPQYDPPTKGRAYGMPLMRFSLAEDEMRELLMGTRLYGDRALCLRELYQNALDACRYRQARLRYGKAAQGIPNTWNGEIVFRYGTDGGRRYIECEDNGVGMGHETLRGTFSRAGRRFEQSRAYRREQARWLRADPSLRIYPNSRFGIGVFSYFMLADEISIWTRATDEYGRAEPDDGLRVDIASSGSLFRIRKSEEAQPGAGTRVRLYLQGDDRVGVADELGKVVWRSEFAMRVEEGDRVLRAWEPGALYYFGDHRRPVRAGTDLWWVEGRGCLLADGVSVNAGAMAEERAERDARAWLEEDARRSDPLDMTESGTGGRGFFGVVVDLRETHAPDISTNRNEILSYDRSWTDGLIESAGADFTPPPWLTLEWLWAFARSHPAAATGIVEKLLADDARITSRLGWNRTNVVEFRRVGCVPWDANLVVLRSRNAGSFQPSRRRGRDQRAAINAWRAGVLRSQDIPLRREVSELPVPETMSGYPDPQAWEARIARGSLDMSRTLINAAVVPPRGDALTLGEVLRRLRRYAIIGLYLPSCGDLEAAHGMALDPVDLRVLGAGGLLRQLLKGIPRTVITTLQIFSAGQRLPLTEALGRARRLAAAGLPIPLPDADPEPHQDAVASYEELEFLERHPRFQGDGQLGRMTRSSALKYAAALDRYTWLGLPPSPVPEEMIDEDPSSATETGSERKATPEDPDEVDDLRACFGLAHVGRPKSLTCRQLAQASGIMALPVQEVVRRHQSTLDRWGARLPDYSGIADRTFTRLDSDLLDARPGLRPYFDGIDEADCPAPLIATAAAVRGEEASAQAVVERLGVLAELGLVDEAAPRLVERWRALSPEDWRLVQGGGFGPRRFDLNRVFTKLRGRIDERYLFAVAASVGASLGAARARLLELGPLVGFEISIRGTVLEREVAEARPTQEDVAVCFVVDRDSVDWASPTLSALTWHAHDGNHTLGESLSTLSRYAPLGARWTEPPRTPDDPGHWRDHSPTVYDVDLFEPDLLGEGPAGPLELLRAAARFGWPIDKTWDRLALYRPLGLELTVDRPDFDTVPTWQDLILLTEHYTGSAPALTGEVNAERIAVTARELEQPTSWVHARLRLYATLFGLTVPDAFPAEPAPMPTPEYYTPPATG